MERLHEPKSEALRALYWRDEILQLMFWIRGEGFGDQVDPPLLERFLGVQTPVAAGHLDRLVGEGLLRRVDGGRYELTELGHGHGARVFAEEFSELTRPAHGECGADCWCRSSAAEAAACLEERMAHGHGAAEADS